MPSPLLFRITAAECALTYADDFDATTMSRLDRSVRAIHELDRNANQSTLIECYAADIAAGVTGERGGIG